MALYMNVMKLFSVAKIETEIQMLGVRFRWDVRNYVFCLVNSFTIAMHTYTPYCITWGESGRTALVQSTCMGWTGVTATLAAVRGNSVIVLCNYLYDCFLLEFLASSLSFSLGSFQFHFTIIVIYLNACHWFNVEHIRLPLRKWNICAFLEMFEAITRLFDPASKRSPSHFETVARSILSGHWEYVCMCVLV